VANDINLESLTAKQRALLAPPSEEELAASRRVLQTAPSEIEMQETRVAEAMPKVAQVSTGEALGRGFASGATFGFGDELSAVAEKAIALVRQKMPFMSESEVANRVLSKPLGELIRENRQEIEETREARPKTFMAGEMLGGISTTAPLGVAGATRGVAAPATGLLSKVVRPAAAVTRTLARRPGQTGLLIGATGGVGEGEGFSGRLGAGLIGGGLGYGIGKVFGTPKSLENAAQDYGRRAVGFIKSTIKKAGGLDKVNQSVETLLEKGIIRGGISEIAQNIDNLKMQAGRQIGRILKTLDKAGFKALNSEQLITKIASSRMPGTQRTIGELLEDPLFKAIKNPFQELAESIRFNIGDESTFAAAQNLKQALRQRGWKLGEELPGKELFREAYKIVSNAVDEAVTKAQPVIKNKGLAKRFIGAKKAYQAAKTAEIGVEDAVQRMAGNRKLGLTDLIFVSNQLAQGRPAAAAATLVGKKIMESGTVKSGLARAAFAASKQMPAVQTAAKLAGPPAVAATTPLVRRPLAEGGR